MGSTSFSNYPIGLPQSEEHPEVSGCQISLDDNLLVCGDRNGIRHAIQTKAFKGRSCGIDCVYRLQAYPRHHPMALEITQVRLANADFPRMPTPQVLESHILTSSPNRSHFGVASSVFCGIRNKKCEAPFCYPRTPRQTQSGGMLALALTVVKRLIKTHSKTFCEMSKLPRNCHFPLVIHTIRPY